jgi:hypothetical protein
MDIIGNGSKALKPPRFQRGYVTEREKKWCHARTLVSGSNASLV